MRKRLAPLSVSFLLLCTLAVSAAAEPVPDSAVSYADRPGASFGGTNLGRVKMSGRYRLAFGVDSEEFVVNDSNADLQERNYRYVFGERLNNTYDPAIYSQYLLNVDFEPKDKWNVHTQIVADPWSYVGTTGEQIQKSDISGTANVRYNLKYFGAFNSTIAEIYRGNNGDSIGFPVIKVQNGRTTRNVVHGFFDFSPGTGGVPFTIPELDIDYEFRPIRKLWVDYAEDDWHVRAFALADQTQALTTDDPLGLSNHKDYWQQSPWLYQYVPVQFFTDGSIQRGYYSDTLSFYARDSEGNRLVLLRGASVEADMGRTYFAGTVAAPYTPWDEEYLSADNVPGAFRLKHKATDRLILGSTYTFRNGLVNDSVADRSQVFAVDARYLQSETVTWKAETAISRREMELMTNQRFERSLEDYAHKLAVETKFDHRADGRTEAELSFTQMDEKFQPTLSRYSNTRDDRFWGKHLSFADMPDLEPFRLGDGVDINRRTYRFHWREKLFQERFENLFDVRHVRRASDDGFKENVFRDEPTFRITPNVTAKGLVRWHKLPTSQLNVEPFVSDYYFIGSEDPSSLTFQNVAVPAGADPSRWTFAGALQWKLDEKWTAEGFVERSNDLPDFPRGLLNSTFRDASQRVDGILIDRLQNFLYGQGPLGGVPPYEYFTVLRQRFIWKPQDEAKVTFHAAQNGYKHAASIDDNVNHQGVSLEFDATKNLTFFFDYTHSNVIDLPKLVATNYSEHDFRGHHNVYASVDWKLRNSTVLRAEYGVFGLGYDSPQVTPYSATSFALPTLDAEQLLRVSLTGDF